MTIRDNGVGLQPGSRNRHGSFGLVGIEERIAILGGSFSINSNGMGSGTTIVVSIPVDGVPAAGATAAGAVATAGLRTDSTPISPVTA
jgi:glucose-6-phosphate-specific signal transduction histidine kinase